MMRCMKKYRSFILRMVGFVIFLSLLIFAGGTIMTGKFWLPDLYEDFVFVACCTFCCSIILHGLYERIYRFPRFLFFSAFMLLSTLGVGIGLMMGVLILEGKLFLHMNFLLAIIIGLLSSIGITFYEVQKSRLEEKMVRLKAAELENEQLRRFESEARFNSLQAKLNPHFLFNTLNSLAALVYEDPPRAEQSIVRLSELYRKVLSISGKTFIPIAEEVELIEDYLELEKLRFNDHLTYQIACPEPLKKKRIPGLLVEPLVENVIKHVQNGMENVLRIKIEFGEKKDRLLISVEDNGLGFDVEKAAYGFGLFSVQERLQLLFGDKGELQLESVSGKGTKAVIRIPAEMEETGLPTNG